PLPPTWLGRRNGAGRTVAGRRAVDSAGRAGAGDVRPGDDAVGAAHARGGTARGRAASMLRGDRSACAGGRAGTTYHGHAGLHAAALQGPKLTFYPGRENRHDRVAFDPGDRRGPVSQSDPEVTSNPFRSRVSRVGSRGKVDPR